MDRGIPKGYIEECKYITVLWANANTISEITIINFKQII